MSLRREIKAGQVLRHQRVVELLDVFEHEDDVHLVGTFFCSLGMLSRLAVGTGRDVCFVADLPFAPQTHDLRRDSFVFAGPKRAFGNPFRGQLLI